jgi:hypothetical protein
MARLIPLTIDIEEAICSAVQLRAAKDGATASEVVNAILGKALTAEIAEVSGLPPLTTLLQKLQQRFRSRLANGSQRPVSYPGELTK